MLVLLKEIHDLKKLFSRLFSIEQMLSKVIKKEMAIKRVTESMTMDRLE